MKLYLLRHGDAVNSYPVNSYSDSNRQLSSYGREQVVTIALDHRLESAAIERVVSSPYRRAVQTTEIFIQAVGLHHRIDWLDDLTPQGDLRAIEGFLQRTNVETVLMVTHLPLVGLLIDYLTGETGTRMGTANLASLSMDFPAQGTASLNWIHHAN
ncbi:MAG: phosphohistidine phosphatase SixA [Pseudomonadales bacterium]